MTSHQMASVPLIWQLGHVRKGVDVFAKRLNMSRNCITQGVSARVQCEPGITQLSLQYVILVFRLVWRKKLQDRPRIWSCCELCGATFTLNPHQVHPRVCTLRSQHTKSRYHKGERQSKWAVSSCVHTDSSTCHCDCKWVSAPFRNVCKSHASCAVHAVWIGGEAWPGALPPSLRVPLPARPRGPTPSTRPSSRRRCFQRGPGPDPFTSHQNHSGKLLRATNGENAISFCTTAFRHVHPHSEAPALEAVNFTLI